MTLNSKTKTDILLCEIVSVEKFLPIFKQLNFINDDSQPDFSRYLKSARINVNTYFKLFLFYKTS